MECVEVRPPSLLDGHCAANVQDSQSSDDSFVEDLLDFGSDDVFGVGEEEEEEEEKCFLSNSQETEKSAQENSVEDFGSLSGSGIIVPSDDAADLEWLSHFVEDSFTDFSEPLAALPEIPTCRRTENQSEQRTPRSDVLCFETPVPVKPRSKRPRPSDWVRSLWFALSSVPSPSSSHSSSLCSNRSQGSEPVQLVMKRPVKKQKRAASEEAGSVHPGRRCTHCGVQKTPQWRAGPMGAKTLCNACGVRFKSGRLLPEYRPACSPHFSDELHSNHHRKVLEMQRKKEFPSQPEEEEAPTCPAFSDNVGFSTSLSV